MNDLIYVNNEISVEKNIKDLGGRTLLISEGTPSIDLKGIINKIFQYVNINDIVKEIKKGTEYVVQVPNEFQQGLDLGEFFMMENQKTGTMWPSLMEIGEDGRNKIVTPLPIKKKEYIQGNPFKEISQSYQNVYMQNQINEIAQLVEQTLDVVKDIEQGQKNDRVALLNSGKKQIVLALNQKDESIRQHAIQLGQHDICLAQEQFFETLKYKAEKFKSIPKLQAMQFFRELIQTGYLSGKDNEYHEVQNYYALYFQSTRMLAASYAINGDIENAKRVFDMSIEQINSIDFKRLKTIGYLHKDQEKEGLHNFATEYLSVEKQICLDAAEEYDCLAITIKGDKLLEVILDEREKTI